MSRDQSSNASTFQSQSGTVIHDDRHGDRVSRLGSMGLTVDQLGQTVQASLGGFTSTTAFHPRSAPGTYLYHEATAALRRAVMPSGNWAYDEDDSQPRTYSDVYGVAVVVQTGDENTGLVNGHEPKARNPKGLATEKKVASNFEQTALFTMSPRHQDVSGTYVNWVLLISIMDDAVARAELSLPRKMSGGKPCGWIERIILPEIELGGGASTVKVGEGDTGPVADIDVAWKQ